MVKRALAGSRQSSGGESSSQPLGRGQQCAEGSHGSPGAGKRIPGCWNRSKRARGKHLAQRRPGVRNEEPREVQPDRRSEDSEPNEGSSGAETHHLASDYGGAGYNTREGRRALKARVSRGRSSRKERRRSKKAFCKRKRARPPSTSSPSSDSSSSSSDSKEERRQRRNSKRSSRSKEVRTGGRKKIAEGVLANQQKVAAAWRSL